MGLTREQRTAMTVEIRELKLKGRPEIAAPLIEALRKDEYLTAEVPDPEPEVEVPSKAAKKVDWQDYARAVSDFDEEVITSVARNDLIAMLEANGLV